MLDFSRANEWKIVETGFDSTALGKAEANFCLGNVYLGLRSATEEKYLGETRDLLVAGTFDRFSEEEVTELPNAADVTNIELTLNGERFDLTQGVLKSYSRELNLKTGLLTRDVEWTSPKGVQYRLKFERIVSLKRLHTIAMRVSVTAEQDVSITFQSGIDGRVNCGGSQHFTEGQTRFYDKKYLKFVPKIIQSNITFVVDTTHKFYVDSQNAEPVSDINILRRHMFSKFTLSVERGQTVTMVKFANVFTTRDRDTAGLSVMELQSYALERLKDDEASGFTVGIWIILFALSLMAALCSIFRQISSVASSTASPITPQETPWLAISHSGSRAMHICSAKNTPPVVPRISATKLLFSCRTSPISLMLSSIRPSAGGAAILAAVFHVLQECVHELSLDLLVAAHHGVLHFFVSAHHGLFNPPVGSDNGLRLFGRF